MGFLSNILMHPEMFALGALAISVPIIIHLLNRRRFKEVDWAAMEFLLDAEQKNRKRVRLEHLILLLLRCLTMLLVGLLIARPFLPSNLTSMLFNTQQFERIVLLDDSMSTQARAGNRSAFELAKEQLVELVQTLSSNDTDDNVTLLILSDPTEPVIASRPVTGENLQEWIDQINELTTSDLSADLGAGLREVDRYVGEPRQDVNRVVYVLSDLLERDWKPSSEGAEEQAAVPHEQLNTLAEKVAGLFLVDIGVDQSANLSIETVRPAEIMLAGVANRVDIRVRNHGLSEVQRVGVRLTVGESLPVEEIIDSIPAGESREVGLPITIGSTPDAPDRFDETPNAPKGETFVSVPIRAELFEVGPDSDVLEADSRGFYAARVAQGIPVLLVDGDPSSDRIRSETVFLERAIRPPGDVASGNMVDVVSYIEFDKVPLSQYRVIALCNVDQLSPTRLAELQQWVTDGGGLVLFPGGRTKPDLFNEQLYADGEGLSPFGLVNVAGDVEREQWASFEISEEPHQVLRVFEGQDNPLIDRVKLFNYWETMVPESLPDSVNLLARLNDVKNSVAIAEKTWGDGHVIGFNVPADNDWTNWPEEGLSFLLMSLDMSTYLAGNVVGISDIQVGQPIKQTVDLTLYQREATLLDPLEERHPLQVKPLGGEQEDEKQAVWQFEFDGTRSLGFYDMTLLGTDDKPVSRIFAASSDPQESGLNRLDLQEARQGMFSERVQIVERDRLTSQSVQGGRRELWRWLIFALIGVLLIEQTLARWFRSRQ